MDAPAQVGPYRLDGVIGRGGVGHVWRAEHRLSGTPVALKVLTHQTFSRPEARAQIESEIRAAALLDHPSLVQVYDTGRVPFGLAELPPGSPWIAMELVDGQSLTRWCGTLTWRGVRHVLLHVLEALAHAHAMGVLHRDVKPGNVLVTPDLGQIKLTDFGLARDLEGMDPGRISIAGTPAFMAPEQIEARWRDFAPATDLYAVGCLTHTLVTGRGIFPGNGMALFDAHLNQPAPPLTIPDAPAGLAGWLAGMLAKRGSERFQRAADAADALLALGDPGPGALVDDHRTPLDPLDGPTLVDSLEARDVRQDADVSTAPWSTPNPSHSARPVPVGWRRPYRPSRAARPRASGLGLLRLRRLPLLGRVAERGALWSALRAVSATGTARALILEGHAGVGKTHLAEWLAVRAHEMGIAEVLRASFAPVAGPAHGLSATLLRWTRCVGLARSEIRARLAARWPAIGADDQRALAAFMAPDAADDPTGAVVFSHPREIHALLRRFLQTIAGDRLVIMLLDDVQHAIDAVECMAALQGAQLPLLCVATARQDVLAGEFVVKEALATLIADGAQRIALGPLGKRTTGRLLGELLGLTPTAATQVEARVQGNPLFAVQLVRDWAQRKAFEATDAGFGLRAEVAVDALPAELHAVWGERVAALLAAHPEAARPLELAATLGVQVDTAEWQAVCAAAGIASPTFALDALLAAGLAYEARHGAARGWAFAHGMLRESVIEEARLSGRLPALHRLCARVLAGRPERWQAERVGLHQLAAEAWAEAAPTLLTAANARYAVGAYRRAHELLDAMFRATAHLAENTVLNAVLQGQVLRARLARAQGRLDMARRLVTSAVERAGDLQPAAALARLEATQLAFDAGEPARASAHLDAALAAARRGPDRRLEARCNDWRAIIALRRGELDQAEAFARTAADLFAQAGDVIGQARCDLMQARIAEQRGQWQTAMRLNRAAQLRYTRQGVRSGLAECANHLGELARQAGELDTAERAYKEALRIWTTIGSGYVAFARANLGLVQHARGDVDAARQSLLPALAEFEADGRLAPATEVNACLLAGAAQQADWAEFDRRLGATRRLVETGEFAHGDVARLTRDAGDHAAEALEVARAIAAWGVAQAQWATLGNATAAGLLAARIARHAPDDEGHQTSR